MKKLNRQVFHAPTADNPIGTVVEEHPCPKPKGTGKSWPYGRFQIFTDGHFVCALDLRIVVEHRKSAYRSIDDLRQAIAEVCSVPLPTMTPALGKKLLDKAYRLAKDADSRKRSRSILHWLNSELYAPEGYTERELQGDWS